MLSGTFVNHTRRLVGLSHARDLPPNSQAAACEGRRSEFVMRKIYLSTQGTMSSQFPMSPHSCPGLLPSEGDPETIQTGNKHKITSPKVTDESIEIRAYINL